MFEIPVGARHLLIQETDATSHNLGKYVTSRKIFSWNILFCCLFLSLEPDSVFMRLFTHYPPTPHTSVKYVKLGNLVGNLISPCRIPPCPSQKIPALACACVKAAGRGAELHYGMQCIIFACVFRNVLPILGHFPATSKSVSGSAPLLTVLTQGCPINHAAWRVIEIRSSQCPVINAKQCLVGCY